MITEHSSEQDMTLGSALAIVEEELLNGPSQLNIDQQDSIADLVGHVRKIYTSIDSQDNFVAEATQFPKSICEQDKPFLAENISTCIAYFLCKHPFKPKSDTCRRLFVHLNDCYFCYEEFADVLRDYYIQKNGKV